MYLYIVKEERNNSSRLGRLGQTLVAPDGPERGKGGTWMDPDMVKDIRTVPINVDCRVRDQDP